MLNGARCLAQGRPSIHGHSVCACVSFSMYVMSIGAAFSSPAHVHRVGAPHMRIVLKLHIKFVVLRSGMTSKVPAEPTCHYRFEVKHI